MPIAKGISLGPYEVLSHIGAGGMGEVWRARDRRIGRDVAIKVLPESFAPGDERVQRFEQEARAAGALNHPGLVTIFDVGITDGAPYIVMELLEGETLRDAIGEERPVRLPLRRAVDYGIQIATALAVAHEKGIIHRDLKPENLFITTDGRVKILDFGLAKLAVDATDVEGRHRTARHLTSAGMVVGTPGYMSPEQVRAQPLDWRTDIFSLGAVLYEMLSGQRAFDCPSAVETMHAVLGEEPPALDQKIPSALDAIVRHCLEKNPRERFQSARDLAFQLRMLPEAQVTTSDRLPLPFPGAVKPRPYRAALATLAVLALAAGGLAIFRGRGGPAPARRAYKQLTSRDGLAMFPTLSPDGKSFAYVSSQTGNLDIYVQRVDGRAAINLTSDSPADDSEPAFSPDGARIAFRSEREGGGIYVMGVTGESPLRITDFGHNPSWSPDGQRVVVSTAAVELRPYSHRIDGDLWIVDTRPGGARRLLLKSTPQTDGLQPSWSPNGQRIAFWGVSTPGQRDIWTIDAKAAEPKTTLAAVTSDAAVDWNPVWSPDGNYLYFGSDRDGTLNLWRVPMDQAAGTPRGAPEPLQLPAPFTCNFAFSQHGDLAYTTVTRSYRLLACPFDAKSGTVGTPRPLFGGSEEIFSFEPSPDGRSFAFSMAGIQEDLYVANADGTRMRQLTSDAARDRGVTWARDGKTIYFYSNRSGPYHVWSIRSDGSGLTQITNDADLKRIGASTLYFPNAAPDGKTLAAQTNRSAVLVHLDRPIGQRLEPIGDSLIRLKWSPDGSKIVAVAGTTPDAANGIAVYSLAERRWDKVADRGVTPLWFAGSGQLLVFDKQTAGVVDVASRQAAWHRLVMPPYVDVDISQTTQLSSDGTTLYIRQSHEQGDIWMLHFEKG